MEEIVLFNDKAECCGCGACMAECPRNAITMEEDEIGALYPVINQELCIKCGKCVRTCGYKNFDNGDEPIEVYGAINNNSDLYNKSASGGVFSLIASEFYKDNGTVVGSVEEYADGKIDCKHIVGKSSEDLERMYGSKYVQSRSFETFAEVKQALKDGKKVLFCGTPCQVAAIKKIAPNQENLYTIDLICHGTPPVKLLQEFLSGLEKKLHSKVVYFAFREKSAGRGFRAAVATEKRKFYFSHGILSYYKLFLDGVIYRKNCYTCPYAQKKRVADLTIGDFWGIENYFPADQVQGKYWSCILVNSTKGQELIEKYGKDFTLLKSDFEQVANKNEQLNRPHDVPALREKYFQLYSEKGYKGIEEEYRKHMGGTFKMFIKEKKQLLENIMR